MTHWKILDAATTKIMILGIIHVVHALKYAGFRGSCLTTRPLGQVFKYVLSNPACVKEMKQCV